MGKFSCLIACWLKLLNLCQDRPSEDGIDDRFVSEGYTVPVAQEFVEQGFVGTQDRHGNLVSGKSGINQGQHEPYWSSMRLNEWGSDIPVEGDLEALSEVSSEAIALKGKLGDQGSDENASVGRASRQQGYVSVVDMLEADCPEPARKYGASPAGRR